jgi:hypothetical protein
MLFDFLGDGGLVFADTLSDPFKGHSTIQTALDLNAVIKGQVLILLWV